MPMQQPKLSKTALAAAVAASFPGFAAAQSVAKVDFAIGVVTATGTDGRTRSLAKGSDIVVGDTVNTNQGRVQLRYADGAQMALQPDTEFKVEEFRFAEGGQGKDNVVMNLVKGGLRTITGVIGRSNRNAYALKTPMATVGIRGTEFTAEMRDTLRTFCVQGLIFVQSGGGTLLLSGGQGAFVANSGTAPQRNDDKPVMPTVSKQEMEVLLKLAGVDPQNPTQDFNPVVTLQTALAQLAKLETTTTTTTTTTPDVRLKGTMTGNAAAVRTVQGTPPLARVNQSITFDSDGKLVSFSDSTSNTTLTLGTATATSLGNDGIIAWGRWSDGTTGGNNPLLSNRNLSSEGPGHYVAGLPVSSMPTTGQATYSMIGHSASCSGGGCTTAKVDSSSLMVDFGHLTVDMMMSLTVDGSAAGTYMRSGSASLLNGNGSFTLGGTFHNSAGCSGNAFTGEGFLSGSGALRAGVAWNGLVGGGVTQVAGANAYEMGSTVASPPRLTGDLTASWAAANPARTGLSQAVKFDNFGRLTQFADSVEGIATPGTATVTSLGNDGVIAWGNWTNGTTGGTHPAYQNRDLTALGPIHYVVGLPISAMPTSGIGTYSMIGSSASCGSGCFMTVNSSTLSVDFANTSVSATLSLQANGIAYPGTYSGSASTGSGGLLGNGTFNLGGSLTGGTAGGSFSASGFLSGAGGVRAGMRWSGSLVAGPNFHGVTAYNRTSLTP